MWATRQRCPSAASCPRPCSGIYLRARPSSASDGLAPDEDGWRCTTRLENAHSTKFRELLYPRHPWSDLRIGIHEAIERPGGVVFRCDLTASDANRWLRP